MVAKSVSKKRDPAQAVSHLYVLDTNVLLHDPMSLFRFEEHDVYLPMVVLEELDNHKQGHTEVARNGRMVSRSIDALLRASPNSHAEGIPLASTGHRESRGRLFFQSGLTQVTNPTGLPETKADNQILGVVLALREMYLNRRVVLVSKDTNVRIKGTIIGIPVEDYESDKVLDDVDLLYSGAHRITASFWEKAHPQYTLEGKECVVTGPATKALLWNQFIYSDPDGSPAVSMMVVDKHSSGARLRVLTDHTGKKGQVLGVTARNREQNFALNLLLDPNIDVVSLVGAAGTGKTLMALAAGLHQIQMGRFTEIIMTRATVPIGEDIGFLPGDEDDKMGPWMGALHDNLEVLDGNTEHIIERGSRDGPLQGSLKSKVKVKALTFMRGRTFLNKFVIIDEAQNLTPKQVKALITRAGPGTKMVLMGNLAQIDTPYLTEGGSGLAYFVDHFKDWPHGGHIILVGGERSRLAGYAEEVL
jgi:PhoH-like ATPase